MKEIMKEIGVTTEEMGKAIAELAKNIPPPSQEDIDLIKKNPSLSFYQKAKIIRSMQKIVKTEFKKKENGQI